MHRNGACLSTPVCSEALISRREFAAKTQLSLTRRSCASRRCGTMAVRKPLWLTSGVPGCGAGVSTAPSTVRCIVQATPWERSVLPSLGSTSVATAVHALVLQHTRLLMWFTLRAAASREPPECVSRGWQLQGCTCTRHQQAERAAVCAHVFYCSSASVELQW